MVTAALSAGDPFRIPAGLAALRTAVWLAGSAREVVGALAAQASSRYDPVADTGAPVRPAPPSYRQPTQRRPADEYVRPGDTQPRPAQDPPTARAAVGRGAVERGSGGRPGGAGPSGRWPVETDEDQPGEVWQLVRRVQDGDAEAFGLIYDRYVDVVFRYVYFRVGSRPLAEDLTSETFLRALRRIGGVSWQGRDLGAWLVTIARNLIADHYKSGRYRLEVTTADMLDADSAERSPDGQPESAVMERLTNATLLDAVKKLNPEQQECITLRFLQGLSVTETAQIMDKNDGAIKALQYRAVRSLGRLLPDGFTP